MYSKLSQKSKEIPEEGLNRHLKSSGGKNNLATQMIAGGEIFLFCCITFLCIVLMNRRDTFMNLINQLLNYDRKMSGKFVKTFENYIMLKYPRCLNTF